jgi:hypothetical protein
VRFKVPSKYVILVEKFNISFSSTKNHKIITLPKKGKRKWKEWNGEKKNREESGGLAP